MVEKKKQYINIILLFAWIASLVYMCYITLYPSERKELMEIEWVDGICHDRMCEIEVSFERHPTKQWMDRGLRGAQYDGVITNHSSSTVYDWKLLIPVLAKTRIDSSWNGQYSIEDGVLTVLPPEDYNLSIPADESITFGFIMYTPLSYEPGNWTLCYTDSVEGSVTSGIWLGWFILFGSFIAAVVGFFLNLRIITLNAKRDQDKLIIEKTMKMFANTIEAKDPYTRGHSQRVAAYSRLIARRLGLDEDDQQSIYYSAILHDVGKIGIADSILNKPGRLTSQEMDVMRTHAAKSAEILEGFDAIPFICDTLRHHHEWFNGSGYPDNLAGEEIPLFSRIICVADCFDAMTSDRCYRSRLNMEQTVEKLTAASGTQFDPAIVHIVLDLIQAGEIPLSL